MFKSLFQPVSRSQFARLIARELRQVGDKRTSQFHAETFQLRFRENGEDVGVANLHNIYEEYSHRTGRDRKDYLKQAVRTLLAPYKKLPAEFVDARPDLMLTVRERSYFTLLEAHHWAKGEESCTWPHLPMGRYLAVGLVYDLPEAMVMLHQQQLDDWDISFYEAYEAAHANLVECEATFSAYDDRLFVADTQDNYDATRILMTDWIRSLTVEGNPIAMVPNRDKLLITGSQDERGLQMMAAMARDVLQLPRPMSGMAFEFDGDEWSPWLPSGDHPAYPRFRRMQLDTLIDIYSSQKSALEKADAWQRSAPELTNLATMHHEGIDDTVTYCVWHEGRTSLLPKTDYIFFKPASVKLSADQSPLYGRWERVAEIVGDLLQTEENMYPERSRVEGFPSTSQLFDLRCDDGLNSPGKLKL